MSEQEEVPAASPGRERAGPGGPAGFVVHALTPAICWELFQWVTAEAAAPIVFRVEGPTGCVLQVAQPGTSQLNGTAVVRKTRTALALGRATATWHGQLRADGLSAETHPLVDPAVHTDIPGGVPLTNGGFTVGAAAVSGMAPAEDHRVLVAALVRHARTYDLATGEPSSRSPGAP